MHMYYPAHVSRRSAVAVAKYTDMQLGPQEAELIPEDTSIAQ